MDEININNQNQPQGPDIVKLDPGKKSKATEATAAKRREMAGKAKSFRNTYCKQDDNSVLPYPDSPVSNDPGDILAEYDVLEERRSQLEKKENATQEEKNQLEADYNAYFTKLKQPENLNKAFRQLSKMIDSDIATHVSGLEDIENAMEANNHNFDSQASRDERILIGKIENQDKADMYLSLLLSASYKESSDGKTATENRNMMAFYRAAKSVLDTTADMTSGRLFVPPLGQEMEEGKKIHRTGTIVYEIEDGKIRYGHNKLNLDKNHGEKYLKEIEEIYKKKDWAIEQGIDVKAEYKPVEHKGPLFYHEPCPEDIQQNALGDCYMIATLQAITAQDPDFIKNAMVKGEDGQITVRFFNEKMEPVYVTVDDTTEGELITFTINNPKPEGPEKQKQSSQNVKKPQKYMNWDKTREEKKREKASNSQPDRLSKPKPTGPIYPKAEQPEVRQVHETLYAVHSRWVGILEKAFAESGLKSENTDRLENSPLEYTGNYGSIEGGQGIKFAKCFLGPYMNPVNEEKIHLPDSNSKGRGSYSNAEKDFLTRISGDLGKGKSIICSKAMGALEREKDAYARSNGLPGGHAYSIFDVKEKDGVMYVGVLDPNRSVERVYDTEGVPYMATNPDNPGESWVELHEFCQTFREVRALDMTKGIVNKNSFLEAVEMQRIYGEAVNGLCRELLEQNGKLAFLSNSRAFNQLAAAAEQSLKAFDSGRPDKELMKKALSELTQKAQAYLNHRNNDPKKPSDEMKTTSASRYFTAEALVKLGEKVSQINTENRPIDQHHTIELHDLKKETMEGPLDPRNNAQRAARQYQQLLEMRTGLIQDMRQEAGYANSETKSKEYQIPEEKMTRLLYIDTLIKERSKMTIDKLDNALQPRNIQEKSQQVQERIHRAIPYMDKELTRKALFSVNPDVNLFAQFSQADKMAVMSPEKREKAIDARKQAKASEEKRWKESVEKARKKESENAIKHIAKRTRSK